MAASDFFEGVVGDLNEKERGLLLEFLRVSQQNLLAARSEEARVRLVEEFIKEMHDRLAAVKKG